MNYEFIIFLENLPQKYEKQYFNMSKSRCNFRQVCASVDEFPRGKRKKGEIEIDSLDSR